MQVNIRINDTLYKKLRELAKEEHRTITAQLDIILTNALEKNTQSSMQKHRNNLQTKEDDLW